MKIRSVVLILLIASFVCAEPNGKCEGNTLVYYGMDNSILRRDCSILHTGNGVIFRGVCKAYDGGADCWRADGDVTPEYREAVRSYDNNSRWLSSFNFTGLATTSTTSTTLICPVCPRCQDTSLIQNQLNSLNYSYEQCNINLKAISALNSKMYSVESYSALSVQKDKLIQDRQTAFLKCQSSLAESDNQKSLYVYVALACLLILFVVVVIWIKFEWIGDPKVKEGFGTVSKRKN